uniref:Uncharacterized protein n=1 Tax=Timema tahoe TaxID=61484 RepID=A0A7R9IFI1_9NEOP|nr:unnamed protein product [Timema tahoe]
MLFVVTCLTDSVNCCLFQSEQADSDRGVSMKRCRWPSRARGFFMRLLASLCLCNSDGNKGS